MRNIILLLSLICLTSCATEGLMEGGRTPLEIRVDIVAYNQDIKDVSTRASINGIYTTFAAGDEIGLFVLNEKGEVIANNYKYMVQKTGHLYRVDDAGNVITSDVYYDENYRYFAYSPYNARYDDYTSIDEIVAKHKELFPTLYADQSSEEVYNAANLLICREAEISGVTMRLTFTHAMSRLKIYYNGDDSDLEVDNPMTLAQMYKPEGEAAYSYIAIPRDNVELYGMALATTTDEENEIIGYSYWHAYVDLKENRSHYVTISSQPLVSYKTAGVDMGLPSGCIWASHNFGTETARQQADRGGKWYDADGNVRTDLMESELHENFDRGDYYAWGELDTKYDQPAIIINETGVITSTGDALNGSGGVTPLISGSKKGYYPGTYIDPGYTYANIDGNIAGTEYDVVRNKLWKGEWRMPNENEVDELMRNCTIEVYDWYYEDNVRYAPWIEATDGDGKYINLHAYNSEFYGTENVRPYRYLVVIFKFTSLINGEVLYFPGGTWSDWSIDMLACGSRNFNGVLSGGIPKEDYGGMYYFASSASHDHIDCSSYMEMEVKHTLDGTGKIINVAPIKKQSTYVNDNGERVTLMGLTQNGHRYTGMLVRPVYGGKNWNVNESTREVIRINIEER
ncbi:MAG: fimbrillin family protein [Bacteroidales bacterium]|nr:fimbrillin family protein [Bacteroidales bacterium]